MADFTLAVRLATSSWYLDSSRSSNVTLALTMAMLSFIRGTWSFMSRIFCSRMISGFSAVEMKKPTKERMSLVKRCHINAPFLLRLWAWFRCGRSRACAGGNWVLGNKGRNRVRNLFLFLLFFQPPAEEALFLLCDLIIVALNFGPLRGDVFIELGLDLRVLLVLARFQVGDGAFLDPLVTVKRLVTPDGILDHVFNVNPGSVERHQDGRALYVGGHGTDVLALEHLRHLHDGIALRRGRNLGRLVDFVKGTGVGDGTGELWLGGHAGGDLGHGLGGTHLSSLRAACVRGIRRAALNGVAGFIHGDKIVVPLLCHATPALPGHFGKVPV